MQKFISDALFGLAFGVGFALANAVIGMLVSVLSRAHT